MIYYLRSILLGLAGAITTMIVITPTVAETSPLLSKPVQDLADAYAQANALLLQGDAKGWSERVRLTKDFVLFSPFGGKPSRYADYTPERVERMGRFFKNGGHQQVIVEAFASDDMVVLATIERDTVEVGGLPSQQWALRVTSVFRRDGANWKLAHRHADPLVDDISLAESARLARGERMITGK
jgi:ketosteroid isomerase-like protein